MIDTHVIGSNRQNMAMDDGHDENIKALRGELFPRKGFYPEKSEVSWGVARQRPLGLLNLNTYKQTTTPSEIYSDESGFRVYLGDSGDARNVEKLDKKQITYVLNAAAGEVHTDGLYEKRIKCLRLDIIDEDWYDISKHIDRALDFISEAKANKAGILVHCVAGVSRSVTVVMAYLMIR